MSRSRELAEFGAAYDSGSPLGFKNRIINGDCRIDQRNAGASVTIGAADVYCLDRWMSQASQASKFSTQQNAGSVMPPAGFTAYHGNTSLSAYSVVATDYFQIQQIIEGLNVADFGWGTANAATVTLSFWVRSSLTGTFGGALANSSVNRSYPFSYTITSSNTWEQKTITIAGDTSGVWLTTNGSGIRLFFSLGMGSNRTGTAGTWAAADYRSATGATSVVGTSGATFYITGVQLEAGSVATPFERRDYGRELMMCQRYYYIKYSQVDFALGFSGTSNAQMQMNLPVTMRAAPTMTNDTASNFLCADGASGYTVTSISYASDINSAYPVPTFTGGTNGRAIALRRSSNTPWIAASAEL